MRSFLVVLTTTLLLFRGLSVSFDSAFALAIAPLSLSSISRSSSSSSSSSKGLLSTTNGGDGPAAAASKKLKNSKNAAQKNQPAFGQAAYVQPPTKRVTHVTPSLLPEDQYRGDSKIATMHKQRIQTAGRVGTKRYVNPCKVFLGNLSFQVTEQSLREWICHQMGLPAHVLLNECKIITEWKTGKSKGYAFVVFTEAIYATVCIETCNGKTWLDRTITVDQGVKKQAVMDVYLLKQKKRAKPGTEDAAIESGIDEIIYMDPEEAAMLKALDPDLLEGVKILGVNDDEIDEMNVIDVDEKYTDGDDEEVDGVWYGDVDEPVTDPDAETLSMNREKRREAARREKRRKKPSKGFGTAA